LFYFVFLSEEYYYLFQGKPVAKKI